MSDYPKIQPKISQPISENLQKLASLFPAAVKDGELDIEALREELGEFAEIQPGDEKYELNWVGKQAAKKKTFEPLLGKTLALKDDGKNADTSENLYIEGDNLEALKLLRQNYYGEVKMIHIIRVRTLFTLTNLKFHKTKAKRRKARFQRQETG
jgi:adenine-specific DNA-methyltransferase